MSLRKTIVGQFRKPHGFLGRLAGWTMANRPSNIDRNLWTVELLDVQPSDNVVEIGCGPGLALEACLLKATQGSVLGLDHSQTMLDQARNRNAAGCENGRLTLKLATLDEAALPAGKFDKICSANVVQFFPDQVKSFRKMFAALKSSGLSATTYMPRNKNASREDALKMAEEVAGNMKLAGFTKIRIEELPMNPVPALCVLGERP